MRDGDDDSSCSVHIFPQSGIWGTQHGQGHRKMAPRKLAYVADFDSQNVIANAQEL